MQINSIQNYSINKNRTPQFKGTVSPEFVKYVDGIRNECLQAVPKRSANLINNVCDSILQKSNEIMKKCFPPTSVLTVDTKIGIVGVEDGILKKYGATLTQSGFIYEDNSPMETLKVLQLLVKGKNLTVFAEAIGKLLQIIDGICFMISNSNDYSKFNEGFSDLEYLLNWWDEHADFPSWDFESYVARKNCISYDMSVLKKQRQVLMQNRPLIPRKDVKPVKEHLREHFEETVQMQYAELYSMRKSEYEMKQLEKELVPPALRAAANNIKPPDNLYQYKIYKIDGTENCYRGPLGCSDISILQPLGLKVINIDFIRNIKFVDNIDKIVDFIKAMQKGSVYFGCNHGMIRSNRAVTLDYYLNPLQKHGSKGGFGLFDYDDLLDLCDELTPEQKKEMQWTEAFEKELKAKLKSKIEFWINNK